MDEAIFHYRGSQDFSESVVDILEIQSNFMLSTAERKFSRTSALFRNRLLSYLKARRALLRFDIHRLWLSQFLNFSYRYSAFPARISLLLPSCLPLWYSSQEIYLSDASGNGAETIDNTRKTCFTFSLRLIIRFIFVEFNRASSDLGFRWCWRIKCHTFQSMIMSQSVQATKCFTKNLLRCRKTGRRQSAGV